MQNIDITFINGILGSILIVTGAAWPIEEVNHPTKSVKNWLFAIGGGVMLLYAILNHIFHQAPFFFIIFELFITVTSVLMMLNTDDRLDTILVSIATIIFIIWSLFLFTDYTTILFIIGLSVTGLGFTMDMSSMRRNVALALGSGMIAIFSFLVSSWIFFFLNSFFCIFSVYYLFSALHKPPYR